MPLNEIEIHPYLEMGESIAATRMIVGTFPIYSLSNPRTFRKDQFQLQRGDTSFFYGSQANYLWSWYKKYVDATIDIKNPRIILSSLQNKGIAISDVITQCSRVNESFEDNSLRNKHWNENLVTIMEGGIDKIICTSKSDRGAMGWLRDNILLPAGFTIYPAESVQLHQYILNSIPSSNTCVKSIAQVLVKQGKKVSIVALPSPGSPQRRLMDFGYVNSVHISANFLNSYLSLAFNWFLL